MTVQFTAAGDFGATANTSAVLAGVRSATPDLTLALGDLSYGVVGAEQAWCDFVTSRLPEGFPFELLAGNHESNGQNGNINDFSACLPNQLPGAVGTYGRQYYVDHPRQAPTVRFVMISPGLTFPDGSWSYAAGTDRYRWTEAVIDDARQDGIPWVVVGMHKPCISMGNYACETAQLNDLLLRKRVDLVLTGHEHLYQRSKQLAHGAACPTLTVGSVNPSCVVDSDADLAKGAGTVYATVGTGGTPLRDVNTADPEAGYFAAWSGLNATPSHGFVDVEADGERLTARFVPSTGTFVDAFSITKSTAPPANQPPSAVMAEPTCQQLTCQLDGRSSTDADGTVVAHSWAFGDGTSASGPTASHTFAAAGSYPVSLTVTDDDGATATTSKVVTVTTASAPVVADAFSRTLASGWGQADVGGAWTVTGSATGTSVSGGWGRLVLPSPGAARQATLEGTATGSADLKVTTSLDKVATGTGTYVSVIGRRVTGVGDFRGVVRVLSGGSVTGTLMRKSWSNVQTNLTTTRTVSGLTMGAGDSFVSRLQVTGTSPTTLRLKVWRAGSPEPAAWLLEGTDTTSGFQAPGHVGVQTSLSSSSTNAPLTVSVDDLHVTAVAP